MALVYKISEETYRDQGSIRTATVVVNIEDDASVGVSLRQETVSAKMNMNKPDAMDLLLADITAQVKGVKSAHEAQAVTNTEMASFKTDLETEISK